MREWFLVSENSASLRYAPSVRKNGDKELGGGGGSLSSTKVTTGYDRNSNSNAVVVDVGKSVSATSVINISEEVSDDAIAAADVMHLSDFEGPSAISGCSVCCCGKC